MDVDLGNAESDTFYITPSFSGSENTFICKYDADAHLIWAKSFESTWWNRSFDLELNNSNELILHGSFLSETDFDPGPGEFILVNDSLVFSSDFYITKLSSNGELIWAKSLKSNSGIFSSTLTVDENDKIYLAGSVSGEADLNPDSTKSFNISGTAKKSGFIAKYESNGDFVWGHEFISSRSIFIDNILCNDNAVFACGYFEGSVDLDPGLSTQIFTTDSGEFNGFYMKLGSNGSFDWVQVLENQKDTRVFDMIITDNKEIIIGGAHDSRHNFNFNGGQSGLVFGRGSFIAKYDSSNNFDWVRNIASDYGLYLNIEGANGNIYGSGIFGNQGDLNVGSGSFNVGGALAWVSYMLKLGPCGNEFVNSSVTACGEYESPSGRYIYNKDGTYQDTILTFYGCDSVLTIDLEINSSTSDSISLQACDTMISPSGRYVWYRSGTYMDTLQNSKGCDSILTIDLDLIGVYNRPIIENVYHIVTNGAFEKYTWIDCDDNNRVIESGTSNRFIPSRNGNYAVIVENNGCIDTSECISVQSVGIRNELTNTLKIYPVPASSQIHISLLNMNIQSANFSIHSITGKLVVSGRLNGNKDQTINISALESGSYILSIQHMNNTYRESFIKN